MIFLYNIALKLYSLAIFIASPFLSKAKKWRLGRKGQWSKIPDFSTAVLWMHCASLGEFEQGRPLLERLKVSHPEKKILLTFFSPSGHEVRANYALADCVLYLPLDSAKNARKFLDRIPVSMAIFVKYDLWFHYLNELQQRKIPTLLISAIFRPKQFYFTRKGAFIEDKIRLISQIFVQTEASYQFLQNRGYTNILRTGDTRLDRVQAISEQACSYPLVDAFSHGKKVIIFGSTWPLDESLILQFLQANKTYNCIVAPHQINEEKVLQLAKKLGAVRYSKATSTSAKNHRVLLIDNIGMLASLYRYARVAYIGGGFKTGLHNTMEAAVYGIPVIFGPKYQKFEEAKALVVNGGGFSIVNFDQLMQVLLKLEEKTTYENAAKAARAYVVENLGATDKIMEVING